MHKLIMLLIVILGIFGSSVCYSQLIWSTYLGGNGFDISSDIKADSAGNAIIFGSTNSTDFPTTTGAFDKINRYGWECFLTKINSTGTALIYSTFLGPNGGYVYGNPGSLYLDNLGNSYIAVTSTEKYPISNYIIDLSKMTGDANVVITKINPFGTALVYSTFIGCGISYEIVIDSSYNAIITGVVMGSYPVTSGAYDTVPNLHQWSKSFISKLNSSGNALINSTFFRFLINSFAIDNSGNILITCNANIGYPVTHNAYDSLFNNKSCHTIGVTKFDPNLSSIIYSTLVGGKSGESASSIKTDNDGNAYFTGNTASSNYPTSPGSFEINYKGNDDILLTKLNSSGTALIYSTYFCSTMEDEGIEIVIDSYNKAYLLGETDGGDIPLTPGALYKNILTNPNRNEGPFLAIFDSTCSKLVYSTYLGYSYPNDAEIRNICLDKENNIYISSTFDDLNIYISPNAYDSTYGGDEDIYVMKLSLNKCTPKLVTIDSLTFPFSCNSTSDQTFYIRNLDSCNVILKAATITGNDSTEFSIISPLISYKSIAGYDSVPVVVRFTLKNKNGVKNAVLNIYDNTLSKVSHINLTGYNYDFTIDGSESDSIIIDLGTICTEGKDTTITIFNKSSNSTIFHIENNDPQLEINVIDKAGKKEGETPQGVKHKKMKNDPSTPLRVPK
jgi:hypothetical protein